MAFTQNSFASVGAHSANTPNLYSYKTTDTLQQVLAANYFLPKQNQLEVGDFILIQAEDGSLFTEVDQTRSGVIAMNGVSPSQLTAFGENSVAEVTPIVQISAQYGRTDDLNIVTSNDGTTLVEDSLYKCVSGTNPIGLASLNALRKADYKPGQGLLGRASCVFDEPTVGTLQAVGLITSEDSLAFGYLSDQFGILIAKGGVVEAQELTLTVAANGSETASVEVDGITYNVTLNETTTEGNAYEIAAALTPLVAPYLVSSNENTVFFMNREPTNVNGAFSYSSTGTSTGTFDQIAAGSDVSINLIPQSTWNIDVADWLDPQSGAVYEIKFSYLGFSAVDFFIKRPDTGENVLVHTLDYSGQVTPIVRNPTFRIGWVARNIGAPTSVTVQGASAMAANEGVVVSDESSRGYSLLDQTATATETSILGIRNRFHFGGIINRSVIKPELLSIATDITRGVLIRVWLNPTFSGPVTWSYIDEENSVAEVMSDQVQITGGTLITTFSATRESPFLLRGGDFKTQVEPDDYIIFTAIKKSGGTGDFVDPAINWIEE